MFFFSGGLGFLMMIVIMAIIFSTILGSSRNRMVQGGPRMHQQLGPMQYPPPYAGAYGAPPLEQPLSQASRDAVDRDITRFGDELRDLDLDVVGHELSEEARTDYSAALDAYENAKQALRNAQLDSDVTHITHILEEGRFKMASVKSRVHGRELPARRPPCFFDPAHGPSTQNVSWTPQGGVAREVPACALDAARVMSGSNPHIRMVEAGPGLVPYWEDPRQAAWARGYYDSWGMDPTIRRMTHGALMIGGFSLLMGLLDD